MNLDAIMADSYACLDRQVHVVAPKWLRRRGYIPSAECLEALPKIDCRDGWERCWAALGAVHDVVGREQIQASGRSEPSRSEAERDGWLANTGRGRWAVQEAHYRKLGRITEEYCFSEVDYGPLHGESSRVAFCDLHQLIRRCVYMAGI